MKPKDERRTEFFNTLLKDVLKINLQEIYPDLIRAVIGYRLDGKFVPGLDQWNSLRDYLADSGQLDLAIMTARAQYETANTSRNMVKLSQLLRESKNAPEAARLFRSYRPLPHNDRAFFFEWASAEGEAGHYAFNAWLAAYSLADARGRDALSRETAGKALNGLGIAFLKLYEATQDLDFAQALVAVGQLGFPIAFDDTNRRNFQRLDREAAKAGVGEQTPAQAWQAIESAIKKAWESCKNDLPEDIPPADKFTYGQLRERLNLPQDAPA